MISKKKNFQHLLKIFQAFFKHFSKDFSMLLKDFGYERCKKSIFFKNNACMKNSTDRKFYLVMYSTPLKAFGKYLRTERQVRFGNDAKNAFFTLVKLCSMKKSILRSKFRLFKNFWEFVLGI